VLGKNAVTPLSEAKNISPLRLCDATLMPDDSLAAIPSATS
jgi:hypothetical protein